LKLEELLVEDSNRYLGLGIQSIARRLGKSLRVLLLDVLKTGLVGVSIGSDISVCPTTLPCGAEVLSVNLMDRQTRYNPCVVIKACSPLKYPYTLAVDSMHNNSSNN
jgi:hypothetical protein